MEKQIDLSIITINYNGLADTLELIDSIEKQNWNFGYEIIVIDNGSKENESKLILEKYPKLIAVRSEENLGFAEKQPSYGRSIRRILVFSEQ